MSVAVIVVPVVVIVVIVVVVPVIVVVHVPGPQRRHPDPLRSGAERGGELAGDRGDPLAGPGLADERLRRQREARDAGARRGEHGVVQRGRRVAEQPHDRRRARDGVLPVRIAQRLDALPGKQRDRDALGGGEREQQQQRELPGKALRREPHPRSTSPANR